jgi:hypothetical protein
VLILNGLQLVFRKFKYGLYPAEKNKHRIPPAEMFRSPRCGDSALELSPGDVVVDATTLNYLIMIYAVQVLPRLFQKIQIPFEIRDELTRDAEHAVESGSASFPFGDFGALFARFR